MADDNHFDEPIAYHDDNRVLRYLLQNVKGLSPVSGGVLGDALEEEYKEGEETTQATDDLGLDSDAIA